MAAGAAAGSVEKLVYREDEEQSVADANQAVMNHCEKYLHHRYRHKRDYPDNGDGESSRGTSMPGVGEQALL